MYSLLFWRDEGFGVRELPGRETGRERGREKDREGSVCVCGCGGGLERERKRVY
jgi:hypothetical protein